MTLTKLIDKLQKMTDKYGNIPIDMWENTKDGHIKTYLLKDAVWVEPDNSHVYLQVESK